MRRTSRRRFLMMTGTTGVGLSLPAKLVLGQLDGDGVPFTDYRALVCVFLLGGNDSFNMLVPRSPAEYNAYASSRQNMALPRDDLLPIAPAGSGSREFGLHPAMPELQALFESGHAAFVVNVGPLVEPTTKAAYLDGAARLPPRLFSHSDQQAQWHMLASPIQSKVGWAGRIADLIRANVAEQRLTTNISLSGATLFQSASLSRPYIMGADGPAGFLGLGTSGRGLTRRRAYERLLTADYDSIYVREYADLQLRALSTLDLIENLLNEAPPLTAQFPDSDLGERLRTIAKLIAVHDRLDMKRQIFFTSIGDFDTHDDQLKRHPRLLADVSASLAAFHEATVELGVSEQITAFTQSDFARTLTSNGDGTDHGWGGVQIVVGGAVRGRALYGEYPSLELDGPEEVGRGRLIPGISADQYAATLARWFGIPDPDLDAVAPNLRNFAQRDLGFMI